MVPVAKLRQLFRIANGKLIRRVAVGSRGKAGEEAGNLGANGYRSVYIDWKRYSTHRIIWAIHYGAWPPGQLDHKDGNPLNNRISNLRLVTQSQNMHNTKRPKNNTSGYKGVARDSRSGKWQVTIQVGGKQKHLGYTQTAYAGYLRRLAAAKKLHKQFARSR